MKQNKEHLIRRIKKIRGQINAIESAIQEERKTTTTLQTLAACKGALSGLMWELIKEHVRASVSVSSETTSSLDHKLRVEDLIRVLKSFSK